MAEAEKRGLLNLRSTVDALPCLVTEKNIALFTRHKVYSETELRSRYEIRLEEYAKVLSIEAETALMMGQREILPAVIGYAGKVAGIVASKKAAGLTAACAAENKLLTRLCDGADRLSEAIDGLKDAALAAHGRDAADAAAYGHDVIIPAMDAVRAVADEMETIVDEKEWPFATYADLLFRV